MAGVGSADTAAYGRHRTNKKKSETDSANASGTLGTEISKKKDHKKNICSSKVSSCGTPKSTHLEHI